MKATTCPEGLYKPVLELFVDLSLRVKGYQAELKHPDVSRDSRLTLSASRNKPPSFDPLSFFTHDS